MDKKLPKFLADGQDLPDKLAILDPRDRFSAQLENLSREPKEILRLIRTSSKHPPASIEAYSAIIRNEFYDFETLLKEKGEATTLSTEGDWSSAWDLWEQAVTFVFWDREREL